MVSLGAFRVLGYLYGFMCITAIVVTIVLCTTGYSKTDGEDMDMPNRYSVILLKLTVPLVFHLVLIIGIKMRNVQVVQVFWWFLIIYASITLHNSFLGAIYFMAWDQIEDAVRYIIQTITFACLFPLGGWIVDGVIKYIKNEHIPERSADFQAFIEKSIRFHK